MDGEGLIILNMLEKQFICPNMYLYSYSLHKISCRWIMKMEIFRRLTVIATSLSCFPLVHADKENKFSSEKCDVMITVSFYKTGC